MTLEIASLRRWFLNHARDLPWRGHPSPYQVWVSEVMLQQTQVAVVIPYFLRWMQKFPTIQDLAAAHVDQVIKAWEGLGYYSRARNLHAAAITVVEQFGGVLPSEESQLLSIKGLGPYTVGAIRAFAFKQRAAAVDGNVLRVLARHELVQEDLGKSRVIAKLREHAQELLPKEEPWVIAEALIELGATVCGRVPQCSICPLHSSCKAHAAGMAHQLPVKVKRVSTEALYRAVALITNCHNQILVRRCGASEIMQDLHEFPAVNIEKIMGQDLPLHWQAIWESQNLPLHLTLQESLPSVQHSYTRFRVTLFPQLFHCLSDSEVAGFFWTPISQLPKLAFSSGHRQLLPYILNTATQAL